MKQEVLLRRTLVCVTPRPDLRFRYWPPKPHWIAYMERQFCNWPRR